MGKASGGRPAILTRKILSAGRLHELDGTIFYKFRVLQKK